MIVSDSDSDDEGGGVSATLALSTSVSVEAVPKRRVVKASSLPQKEEAEEAEVVGGGDGSDAFDSDSDKSVTLDDVLLQLMGRVEPISTRLKAQLTEWAEADTHKVNFPARL